MSMRLEIVHVGDQFTLSMADKRIGPARRRTGTHSLTDRNAWSPVPIARTRTNSFSGTSPR